VASHICDTKKMNLSGTCCQPLEIHDAHCKTDEIESALCQRKKLASSSESEEQQLQLLIAKAHTSFVSLFESSFLPRAAAMNTQHSTTASLHNGPRKTEGGRKQNTHAVYNHLESSLFGLRE